MEPLRWGIIGAGNVAEFKGGPALQHTAGSTLHAVMRRDAAQAAALAARMGVPAVYTRAADLLADPAVDAVYIATPVASHYAYTLAAARAGKHVLVEKPMALSRAQCAAMIRACAAAGVQLGVAYYRRFYPVVQHIQAMLAAGTLGTLLAARAQYVTPRVPQPHDWRLQPAISGGGCLADVGSHRLDLLLALLGPVTAVSASMAIPAQQQVEFSASVLLHMESGAHATCSIVWGSASFCDELDIIGSHGRLVASPLDHGTLTHWRGERAETIHLPPLLPTHAGLVHDFVTAVRAGRAVGVPAALAWLQAPCSQRPIARRKPANPLTWRASWCLWRAHSPRGCRGCRSPAPTLDQRR